jgi:threonine dehydrogenase-like Zn-dependent dehydrogenase
MVRRPCPHEHCTSCRADRQDFCFTSDFRERGIGGAHGFMTEIVVEEERYLNPVPRELRDSAILVEPLTIAEKALIQLWEIQERLPWECRHSHPGGNGSAGRGSCHRAVVLGAGPVGLLGAMALASQGFETTVYSRSSAPAERAALIESFGARFVPAESMTVEQLARQVGRIDLIYEAVGASALAFEALGFLGANGVFVFTGVPGRKGPVAIDTDRIMRNIVLNNQIVLGTVNAGREAFEAAIRDLESFEQRWPRAIRSLITGRFPLEAHQDLLLGRAQGIKNVLAFAEAN